MGFLRSMAAQVWRGFGDVLRGRRGRAQQSILAALCAVCLLSLAGTALLFASQGGSGPSTPSTSSPIVRAATATPFATATITPTRVSTATATARPASPSAPPAAKTVSSQPVQVPPPPPPPPPPPAATPTATPCPTATPMPTATATATAGATATATAATATAGATVGATATATSAASPTAGATTLLAHGGVLDSPPAMQPGDACTPCGQDAGNNPSQSAIRTALSAAADQYGLPHNLVYGFAWEESQWHQDVISCDGGVGLMQIQYYYADYFNHSSVLNASGCGLSDTSYDIYTLDGNAQLGAKVIKYLSCYYKRVAASKYSAAGSAFPDTSSNPSLCSELYTNNTNGPTATLYQDLPSAVTDGWSCPLDPSQGLTSAEVLDYSISAYNAGQTAIYNCSCIPNLGYVGAVEYWVTEFQQGTLPKAS